MKITTAGESHGKELLAVLEGFPAGVPLDMGAIDAALALRQSGYGRGERQRIECDRAEILSGVSHARTTGAPIAISVKNADAGEAAERPLTAPRPGHADLAGMRKFDETDARNISERASARESAVRVAAGEVCRGLLSLLGIKILSYTRAVGCIEDDRDYPFEKLFEREEDLHMLDLSLAERAKGEIDAAKAAGDTLGGVCEVRVRGLKSGFGSCMTYAERLDARLSFAAMSVQAAKGVEWGAGFAGTALRGSAFHDEIFAHESEFYRKTNRAGGVEGGMSNGEELIFRVAMKPLPTLRTGLSTYDLAANKPARAAAERGDTCAIVAFGQILESVTAAELCAVLLERLGGDTLAQISARYGELLR